MVERKRIDIIMWQVLILIQMRELELNKERAFSELDLCWWTYIPIGVYSLTHPDWEVESHGYGELASQVP